MKVNEIINDDCLKVMSEMSDSCVDVTITSPPYNAGENIRGTFYKEYEDNMDEEAYYQFIKKTIEESIRVTKYYVFFNFQILSTNKHAYLRIMNDFRFNIKEVMVWCKKQVQPAIQPTCLSSGFEFILVFTKPDMASKRTFERAFFNQRLSGSENKNYNYIYGDSASITELAVDKGTNKATFPRYLVRWFIDRFTQKDDIVFDPFMGSGTTAIVAQQNQRRYFGCELDKEQVALAKKSLTQNTLIDFASDLNE